MHKKPTPTIEPLFKREQVWQLLDSLIALMMLYLSVMLLCQAWST